MSASVSRKPFVTFDDLEQALRFELSTSPFAAVIHLAAVGDYSVTAIKSEGRCLEQHEKGKIDSANEVTIHLKQNPKLIDRLREYACDKNILVVAFKLTNTADVHERIAAVRTLASRARPDFIVHNDLSSIETTPNTPRSRHRSTLYSVDDKAKIQSLNEVETKIDLATELEKILDAKITKEMSK
jgi:phosphopantothenoylcysteine synthetase/decarboxylase